jgi:3-hydroxyisobutyrate dehydrogenase-like beta-hydroxyacid dehydrogenase
MIIIIILDALRLVLMRQAYRAVWWHRKRFGAVAHTFKVTALPFAEPLTAAPAAPAPIKLVSNHPQVETAIVARLTQTGGTLATSQRGLAVLIGSSAPTVNRVLAALVAGGVVAMQAGPDGTVLRLVA